VIQNFDGEIRNGRELLRVQLPTQLTRIECSCLRPLTLLESSHASFPVLSENIPVQFSLGKTHGNGIVQVEPFVCADEDEYDPTGLSKEPLFAVSLVHVHAVVMVVDVLLE